VEHVVFGKPVPTLGPKAENKIFRDHALMGSDPEWLKYAQLAVAALTPIMTGVVGIILVRMGNKLDVTKQLHQELLRKRLQLFEDVAPKINDVFCFFQAVGHWADLNPDEIIKRKRAVDRVLQVNRYLFRSDFWEAYQRFEAEHFDMFAAPGHPARLRLDVAHFQKLVGQAFRPEWSDLISAKEGDHNEQRRSYQALMEILGKEMRGA
jgi:hypothetical protein